MTITIAVQITAALELPQRCYTDEAARTLPPGTPFTIWCPCPKCGGADVRG